MKNRSQTRAMHESSLEAGLEQLVEDSRSLWVPKRIREYGTQGNALQFVREHIGQSVPCVWRGAAKNWAGVTKWKDENQDYLRGKVGDTVVEVGWTPDGRADAVVDVILCNGARGQVFAMAHERKQKFGDVLDELCGWRTSGGPQRGIPYYSAQDSSLTRDMPELLEDIDESVLEFAVEGFGAKASATNVWVGDGRSVTTMHADPFENMYAVVTGAKRFRLRPPCDAAILHKPALRRARWEAIEEGEAEGEGNGKVLRTEKEYEGWRLMNEDGITRWIDEERIDEGSGCELVVRVEAGDLLYLPALWFHSVEQEGLTIAVNWWFEMTFGRDWVYRELCFNLQNAFKGESLETDSDK